MRKGEGSQDGSCLQNLNASKPRNGNHYTVSLPCAQSHMRPSTSPSQATCEEKGETKGNEGKWAPLQPAIPRREQNRDCEQSFRGEITLSHSQRVTASQGTRRSLGLESSLQSREYTHTHTHTDSHTWDFTNPHPRPCLPPHSHTKCILLTSPLSSPHSPGESGELRDPSGDSWKCHPPTPSVRHPHPFDSTFYTHTHTLLPWLSSDSPLPRKHGMSARTGHQASVSSTPPSPAPLARWL